MRWEHGGICAIIQAGIQINLYVGKCKLGLGTVIRAPFVSNKGYKATKRIRQAERKGGWQKQESEIREKGERTGVRTKKGNTVCAPSGVVYTSNMLVQNTIFCKGIAVIYSGHRRNLSRNSCYVYSQDTEKSKNTSKQGSGSLVGTYFWICVIDSVLPTVQLR